MAKKLTIDQVGSALDEVTTDLYNKLAEAHTRFDSWKVRMDVDAIRESVEELAGLYTQMSLTMSTMSTLLKVQYDQNPDK